MDESYIKRKILKHLEKYGWFVKFYSGMGMGRAGVPDILGCINGWFIAIEVKTKKGYMTKYQEHELEQIKKKGNGLSVVAYGWDDFVSKFNLILKSIGYKEAKNERKNV